jgi:hypothetical protein
MLRYCCGRLYAHSVKNPRNVRLDPDSASVSELSSGTTVAHPTLSPDHRGMQLFLVGGAILPASFWKSAAMEEVV